MHVRGRPKLPVTLEAALSLRSRGPIAPFRPARRDRGPCGSLPFQQGGKLILHTTNNSATVPSLIYPEWRRFHFPDFNDYILLASKPDFVAMRFYTHELGRFLIEMQL